jgi:hypothetical protein
MPVAPSLNVTAPEGMVVPGVAEALAVNLTACVSAAGLMELESDTEEFAPVTAKATVFEVLAANWVSAE